MEDNKLKISLSSLKLKNPVLVASGTFGYGREYSEIFDIGKIGAIITKTVTLFAREGNPPPRIAETPCGLLNSIGLQNQGVDYFIKNEIPGIKKFNTVIITSVGGSCAEDFCRVIRKLDEASFSDAYELNLSCPNVIYGFSPKLSRSGSNLIAQDVFLTFEVVKAVRKTTKKPIFAKLSPNVTDIIPIARSCYDAGADGLTVANTYPAMSINMDKRSPDLGSITGGLSGPAVKPLTLKLVWEVSKEIDLPVIASGGIMSFEDAIEYIIAGATAVSIGTATIVSPKAAEDIIEGISRYLTKQNISSVQELVGLLNS